MATNFDTGIRLADEEKEMAGKAIYEAKRNNPEMTWTAAMDVGRQLLPEGRKIPNSIVNPSSYPWLKRMLIKLSKENDWDVFKVVKSGTAKLTFEQQENFAAACYKLHKENNKWSWKKVFTEVGKTMPGIGSSYVSPTQMDWLQSLLDQYAAEDQTKLMEEQVNKLLAEKNKEETIKKAEPVIINIEPVAQPEPEKTEECRPAQDSEILPIAPPDGMMTLETALINAIVGTVTPMIMNILKSPEFSDALRTAFVAPMLTAGTETNPVTCLAPRPPKEARPKILIVGLLPQQGQEIHQLYGKRYDLRIFDSNVTSEKIRSLMPNMDRAIVMTKFISHRVQDVLRGHAGFCHCNGSVAALKELLNTRDAH